MPATSLGSNAVGRLASRNLQLSAVMTQSKVGDGGLDNQKIELFPYVQVPPSASTHKSPLKLVTEP